MKGNKISV